jgi:WhiB family redox-sensing transcriptional regulator
MREPRQYEAPLCAEVDGDIWFPEQGSDHRVIGVAKSVCKRCTHQFECAEWGIHKERFGIWGGLTASDREVVRRKRKIRLPRESREGCA